MSSTAPRFPSLSSSPHLYVLSAHSFAPLLTSTQVYIERAKEHLHITVEDFAHERVFLGALIVAAKVDLFCGLP